MALSQGLGVTIWGEQRSISHTFPNILKTKLNRSSQLSGAKILNNNFRITLFRHENVGQEEKGES